MKICTKCKELRDASLFHKDSKGIKGLASRCKYCINAYVEIINLKDEVWKPIPDYEGYFVSNKGRVKSLNRGLPKLLAPIYYQRYYSVGLSREQDKKQFRIHYLVMKTFVGERPTPEMHIDHIDGNKLNNCLENLEYVTPKENQQRAREMGLIPLRNPNSKLSDEQVLDIRRLLKEGVSGAQLANNFAISQTTIREIKTNKYYKHLTIND